MQEGAGPAALNATKPQVSAVCVLAVQNGEWRELGRG